MFFVCRLVLFRQLLFNSLANRAHNISRESIRRELLKRLVSLKISGNIRVKFWAIVCNSQLGKAENEMAEPGITFTNHIKTGVSLNLPVRPLPAWLCTR